jgi:hypothetical protein
MIPKTDSEIENAFLFLWRVFLQYETQIITNGISPVMESKNVGVGLFVVSALVLCRNLSRQRLNQQLNDHMAKFKHSGSSFPRNESEFSLGLNQYDSIEMSLNDLGEFCSIGKLAWAIGKQVVISSVVLALGYGVYIGVKQRR